MTYLWAVISNQHRDIQVTLDRLLVAPADQREAGLIELSRALLAHGEAEDRVLYPAVAEVSEELLAATQEARECHAVLASRLQTALTAVRGGEAEENVSEALSGVRVALSEHLVEEDNLLFPALRELPDERLDELAAAFDAASQR